MEISVTCKKNCTKMFCCRMTVPHSCYVGRAYQYNRVNQHQHVAQLILSIFRQPLHVSGASRPIIRRYNRMYTTFGTVCCLGGIGIQSIQDNGHLKRMISTKCSIHTVVPPDDGSRCARNV